ncbi:hypothetical protein B0I37DRAFT_366161 [Chaetomium sp. MPI-CAGE-AT-0009]|nr:hypothetical protein B0I37DRAFT_366161 [Chaetomium sp. MPI-CAGE-AT-0009]
MSAVRRYMSLAIVQSYYEDLNEKSDGDVVRHLWNAILSIYFTVAEDFGVVVLPRVDFKYSKEPNDVTIACVDHHDATRIRTALYLFEDRRVKFERQDSVLTAAKVHLTGYMIKQRETSMQENEVIYGVVTVGRYSRFYLLEPGQDRLVSYPGTEDDDVYEFKKDEAKILSILLAIKSAVLRPSTASRPGSRGKA